MPGPKTYRGPLCWYRLRYHSGGGWSAGRQGHCGVWGYGDPVRALLGARRLHKLTRGSRRSAGVPDITTTFSSLSGLNPQHAWIDYAAVLPDHPRRRRTDRQ